MSWSDAARALAAGLLAVLAGCGFELAGRPELPPQLATTYIQAEDRFTPFFRELTTRLRQGGVAVVDSPGDARAVIQVLVDDTGRRLLSVSARNVPTEYEVYYRVSFAVRIDGAEAVPAERLALSRDQTFNEDFVLGKAGEEQVLREALARDLVTLVARRLSTIPPPGTVDTGGSTAPQTASPPAP
jgi:LPS-assembly lipoprotein